MSKRNFALLITVLVILGILAFAFFSSTKAPSTPTSEEGGINFFAKFNPFRRDTPTTDNKTDEVPADISGNEPEGEEATTSEAEIVKLKKISSMPVAGFGVFMKERSITPPTEEAAPIEGVVKKPAPKKPAPKTEFIPALRYVDRVTGNIYQTFADKINEQKFSSTLIPKVYEANFGDKSEKVIIRYLTPDGANIQTFSGSLPKEVLGIDPDGSVELKGTFLPANITDLSTSPDLLKIFYLLEVEGDAIGTTANILGDTKVQVFSSPFTEWSSQWPNKNMITLTTKPSSGIPGYMYAIDPAKKNFIKVLGNINGLTTITSPDGKFVLYADNNLSLGIYDIGKRGVESLGIKTLPEKCVWNKSSTMVYCAAPKLIRSGSYPDFWYRGEVSFSDDIWKIDILSKNTDLISNPTSIGEDIDGIKLAIDRDENYLFFVNKKDSFLWKLDLR